MKTCPYCKEEVQEKAKKCRYCGEWFIGDEKKADKSEIIDKKPVKEKTVKEKKEKNKENKIEMADKEEKKLEGLSGWLIFVGIGLILSPFIILSTINDIHITMINNGYLAQLTNITSSLYIEGFLSLFIFEFFCNLAFIVFATALIYYYFSKHKLFPLLFKIYVVGFFIFNLLDYILPDMIPDIAEIEDDGEYLVILIKSFIYMLIWGLYMHVSKRVKDTFINDTFGKIKIIPAILIAIIGFIVVVSLLQIDLSKLSYNENRYATNVCVTTYGVNSIYSGEKEDGQYLCDCKEGYEFGGKDGNECVISLENNFVGYYSEVFNINSWLYINNAKQLINEELDIEYLKQINEYASKGFLTHKGNYALFIPEEIDQETAELYADEKNKNQNLLGFKSLVLGFDGKNIESDIKNIGGINFFTFTYEVIIDGEVFYYYAIFGGKEQEFMNTYLMGLGKDSVISEGEFIMSNIKVNFNNEDSVWIDDYNKMMWQKMPIYSNSWSEANKIAENNTLGGYNNWRLPTSEEIKSIYSFSNSYTCSSKYPNILDYKYRGYWTSSDTDVNFYGYKGKMYFSSNISGDCTFPGYEMTNGGGVRLVRDI